MTFKHLSKCSFHIQTLFWAAITVVLVCGQTVMLSTFVMVVLCVMFSCCSVCSRSHELSRSFPPLRWGASVWSPDVRLCWTFLSWRGSDGGPAARLTGGGNSDSIKGSDVTKQTTVHHLWTLTRPFSHLSEKLDVLLVADGPFRRSVNGCVRGETWCLLQGNI